MKPATLEQLLRAPVGRYCGGDSYLFWCFSSTLSGTVHWGHRTRADAQQLLRLYSLAGHADLRSPVHRVVDGRELESIDSDGYGLMVEQLRSSVSALRRHVGRQALLVAPDFQGAKNVALLPAFGPTDTFKVFYDAPAAFQFASPADGPAAMAAVDEALAGVRDVPWLLRRLRAHLDARASTSVRAAAAALSMSTRTLQRRLKEAGVTLRGELALARLRRAKHLLHTTDAKLDDIARRTGFSSGSRLSALFRRMNEPPPREVRRRGGSARS